MTTPKIAPLSPHAQIMVDLFRALNSEFPEVRAMVESDFMPWNEEEREVLAALDAFADEQVEGGPG